MNFVPTDDIINAIESGTSQIIRRVEIYESDGVTRWNPDVENDPSFARLIDGSISVDSSRDERRTLDLTLGNADKLLRPNSEGGLWYDKIIKIFRGIYYAASDLPPSIALVEITGSSIAAYKFRSVLAGLGFTRTDVFTSAVGYSDVIKYDIILSFTGATATSKSQLLKDAYAAGKSVATISSLNGITELSFVTAVMSPDAAVSWGITPPPNDNPLVTGWQSESETDASVNSYNDFLNPSFESDVSNTVLTNLTAAQDSVWFERGSKSCKLRTVAANAVTKFRLNGSGAGSGTVATSSSYVSARVRIKAIRACTLRMNIDCYTTAGTVFLNSSTGTLFTMKAGQERIFERRNMQPVSTTDEVRVVWDLFEHDTTNPIAIADYVKIDSARINITTERVTDNPIPYFDGSTVDNSSYTFDWTGTVNASRSIRTPVGYTGPVAGTRPTALDSTAQSVAVWTSGSDPEGITGIIARNQQGGRWFDLHLPAASGTQALMLLKAGIKWLQNFTAYKTWEIQMGEFAIDSIAEDNFPYQIKITGRDYTKLCLNSKFTKAVTFVAGTSLYNLILSLAVNSGVKKIKLPALNEVLTSDVSADRGTARWEIMKSAADSFGYEIYFDRQGYLVMNKYTDPALSPVSQIFQTGKSGNLVSYSRSLNDSRIYNHVTVYGDPADGEEDRLPYFGEAINDDPSSPTWIERIGDRLYTFASTFFSSDQQAQNIAVSYLKVKALESYELSVGSIYYPWLEANTTVEILDPDAFDFEPTRFLMDTITFPLGLAPMELTAKRVTFVSGTTI